MVLFKPALVNKWTKQSQQRRASTGSKWYIIDFADTKRIIQKSYFASLPKFSETRAAFAEMEQALLEILKRFTLLSNAWLNHA